jgi:hypothetical protein
MFLSSPISGAIVNIKVDGQSIEFFNVTLKRLNFYGLTDFTIKAQYAQLTSDYSYTLISGNQIEEPFTFRLSNKTTAHLVLTNSTGAYDLSVSEGLISVNSSDLLLMANRPSIHVNGTTQFESARIQYINPYVSLAGVVRNSLQIVGNASFAVQFSGDGVSVIDDFSYAGFVSSSSTQEPPALGISWLPLLSSPIFLTFYLLIIILFISYLIKRVRINEQE